MRRQNGEAPDNFAMWMVTGAVAVAAVFLLAMFFYGQKQWHEEQAIQREVLTRYLADQHLATGAQALNLTEDVLHFVVGDREYPTQWPFHVLPSTRSDSDKFLISANALALAYRSSSHGGYRERYQRALSQETSFLLLASISEGRTDMASQVAMLQGLSK